jgi:hypothetical protein
MRRSRVVAAIVVAGTVMVASLDASAAPVVPSTESLALRTPTDDLGAHPILRWKAVADADHYLVVVQTPKGAPYWTWQGADTRVRFGGGPLDAPEKSAGARLDKKKVWFVIAYGADGTVIASSAKRALAP